MKNLLFIFLCLFMISCGSPYQNYDQVSYGGVDYARIYRNGVPVYIPWNSFDYDSYRRNSSYYDSYRSSSNNINSNNVTIKQKNVTNNYDGNSNTSTSTGTTTETNKGQNKRNIWDKVVPTNNIPNTNNATNQNTGQNRRTILGGNNKPNISTTKQTNTGQKRRTGL